MKKNKSIAGKIFRFLRNLFALIGLAFVIYHLCFDVTVIVSDSMAPTLKGNATSPKDYVISEKITYLFRKPRRWEIVQYETDDELALKVMKRIVALKGETVSIKDYWICIDGKPVKRPVKLDFLKYYAVGELHNEREVYCEDGYFLLGDDSMDSYDCRFSGPVNSDRFEGRAFMIIWPPSRIRLL